MFKKIFIRLNYYCFTLINIASGVSVDTFGLSDETVPEKNNNITIRCDVTISASDGIQSLLVLKATERIVTCYLSTDGIDVCSREFGVSARYTANYNQPSVLFNISSLQRSDGGDWYCGFQSLSIRSKYELIVYRTIEGIYISDNTSPVKGNSIQMVCAISQFSSQDAVSIYKTDLSVISGSLPVSLTQCIPSTCLQNSLGRYTFSSDNSKVYINITNLNRSEDQKYWTCVLDTQRKGMYLTINRTLERIYIGNNQPAVKRASIQLVCDISQFNSQNLVTLYKTDSRVLSGSLPTSLTACVPSVCFTTRIGRYSFSVDNSNVYINITNLNRSEDQKYWTCVIGTQRKDMFLTIYTVPQTLQFDNPPNQDQDLLLTTVTLQCSTGCAYPQPPIKWFYIESGESRQEWSTPASVTNKAEGCTDSEKMYTSTLSLARYTSFPGKNTTTARFICGITSFAGVTQPLYSALSVNIKFAVLAGTPLLTNWTSGSPEFLSDEEMTLVCRSTPTRPAVSVVWKKGKSTLKNVQNIESTNSVGLVIVMSKVTFTPQISDNGTTISCETSITNQSPQKVQHSVSVWWPPSTPSIPINTFPWLEGQKGKQLKCESSNYGNPVADVVWISSIGTPSSTILNLRSLTKYYNGLNVTCQLKNEYTERLSRIVESKTIQLEVQYKPDIFIHIDNVEIYRIVRNEGQSLIAICSAKGNPIPSVTWQGQTTGSTQLVFTDIDRKDHGSYRCDATASSSHYPTYDVSNKTTLHVTVNFTKSSAMLTDAPEVAVNLSNSDPTENSSLQIICKAVGRPTNYTYTSIVQTWEGVEIPNKHKQANGIIEVSRLQLQDSGTYTCMVNNGIRDRNQQLTQIGNKKFIVKVSPKLLLEGIHTFTGAIGTSSNITVPFYCYPEIRSVTFRLPNRSEITNSSKYEVLYRRHIVKDIFYGQPVSLEGYIAVLQIKNVVESDFAIYILVLRNDVGPSKEWTLEHSSEKDERRQSPVAAIAGGSSTALVVVAIAVVVVIFIRKRRMKNKDERSNERKLEEPRTTAETSYCNLTSPEDIHQYSTVESETRFQHETSQETGNQESVSHDGTHQYTNVKPETALQYETLQETLKDNKATDTYDQLQLRNDRVPSTDSTATAEAPVTTVTTDVNKTYENLKV